HWTMSRSSRAFQCFSAFVPPATNRISIVTPTKPALSFSSRMRSVPGNTAANLECPLLGRVLGVERTTVHIAKRRERRQHNRCSVRPHFDQKAGQLIPESPRLRFVRRGQREKCFANLDRR